MIISARFKQNLFAGSNRKIGNGVLGNFNLAVHPQACENNRNGVLAYAPFTLLLGIYSRKRKTVFFLQIHGGNGFLGAGF